MAAPISWSRVERKARLTYFRALLERFRTPLLAFATVWVLGAICHVTLLFPYAEGWQLTSDGISAPYLVKIFSQVIAALYFSLGMIFLQPVVDASEVFQRIPSPLARIVMETMYVVAPLLGLLAIGSIVRFLMLLFRRDANEREWHEVLAGAMRDHVILCGSGHVGWRVLRGLLLNDEHVVVIEQDPQAPFLSEIRALKRVPIIIGDASESATLHRANLAGAKTVIAATDRDITNLDIALTTRRHHAETHAIMRVYDQVLGTSLAASLGVETISVTGIAAESFARAASQKPAYQSIDVAGERLALAEVPVLADSPLLGKTMGAIRNEFGLTALASLSPEGWQEFYLHKMLPPMPELEAPTKQDYRLILTGSESALSKLDTGWNTPAPPTPGSVESATDLRDHIVVTGVSEVGYLTACRLLAKGELVAAVTRSPGRVESRMLRRQLPAPLVAGDATDPDVLSQAGIEHAKAVVATNSDELMNLRLVMTARQLNPDIRIVMRLFDRHLGHKLRQELAPAVALSTSDLSGKAFVAAAMRDLAHIPVYLNAAMTFMLPLRWIDADGTGHTVEGIAREFGVTVAHIRDGNGETVTLHRTATLRHGYRLVVIASIERLRNIIRLTGAEQLDAN